MEKFKDDEVDFHPDTTLRELESIYGREAVRRGVRYMHSLSEADQKFKESAKKAEKYRENAVEGLTEEAEDDTGNYLAERWKEGMRNGIGLEDE